MTKNINMHLQVGRRDTGMSGILVAKQVRKMEEQWNTIIIQLMTII